MPDEIEKGKGTSAAPEEQNVTLPQDVLNRILKQLDEQTAQLQKNAGEMAILRDSVSQGRLLEAENKTKPAEQPLAYLKVYEGKTVIGWKSEKAETLYHPSNPDVALGEVLKTRLFYLEGGDSGIIDQVLLTRTDDRVNVRLQHTRDELKNPHLTKVMVKFEKLITAPGHEDLINNYKMPTEEIEIPLTFLNP